MAEDVPNLLAKAYRLRDLDSDVDDLAAEHVGLPETPDAERILREGRLHVGESRSGQRDPSERPDGGYEMTRVVGVVEGDENLADGEVHEGAVADAPGVAGDSVLVRDVSGASFDETARLAEDSRSAREDLLLDGDYFFLELDDFVDDLAFREVSVVGSIVSLDGSIVSLDGSIVDGSVSIIARVALGLEREFPEVEREEKVLEREEKVVNVESLVIDVEDKGVELD